MATMDGATVASCVNCGEAIEDISRAGWKRTADGKDYFAHHGMCPSKVEAFWSKVEAMRSSLRNLKQTVDATKVGAMLAVIDAAKVEAHVG